MLHRKVVPAATARRGARGFDEAPLAPVGLDALAAVCARAAGLPAAPGASVQRVANRMAGVAGAKHRAGTAARHDSAAAAAARPHRQGLGAAQLSKEDAAEQRAAMSYTSTDPLAEDGDTEDVATAVAKARAPDEEAAGPAPTKREPESQHDLRKAVLGAKRARAAGGGTAAAEADPTAPEADGDVDVAAPSRPQPAGAAPVSRADAVERRRLKALYATTRKRR